MKKQIIYIFTFILFPTLIFSQSDELTSKKELGINIGSLVTDLLRDEIQITDLTSRNYLLSFKSINIETQKAFRAGVSFAKKKNKSPIFGEIDDLRADLRLGYEVQKPLTHKWQINRGVDIAASYYRSKFEFTEFNPRSLQLGIIPFLGVQLNINPRVHLSTEFGLGFFYSKQKNTFNLDDPVFRASDNNNATSVLFQTPQELILSVSF